MAFQFLSERSRVLLLVLIYGIPWLYWIALVNYRMTGLTGLTGLMYLWFLQTYKLESFLIKTKIVLFYYFSMKINSRIILYNYSLWFSV